jgi:hypothetical protein
MRRSRVSQWRWFGGAMFFLGLPFAAFLAMGCARTNPYYDHVEIPELSGDSVTYIPLTIVNSRVRDALDPHFYLISNGKHPLGIVKGMGEKRTVLVDTRWIRSDGMVTIIAHYPGSGDFTYEQFQWFPGQVIDVSLDEIFNPISAWAHR